MDSRATSFPRNGQQRLRLVGVDDRAAEVTHDRARPPAEVAARRAVAQENHAAHRTAQVLPETDLRMVFAVNVARSLQGGRAAILTPERRRGLVTAAETMGLKPFAANLVIAMVQHAAREGEDVSSGAVAGVLPLVRAGRAGPAERRGPSFGVLFGITGVVAAALFVAMRWLFSA